MALMAKCVTFKNVLPMDILSLRLDWMTGMKTASAILPHALANTKKTK